MEVIKRDGRLQKFDLDKIKISIERASDDINQLLNKSDIDGIANKTQKYLIEKHQNKVESHEIHRQVVKTLNEYGFHAVAQAYDEV